MRRKLKLGWMALVVPALVMGCENGVTDPTVIDVPGPSLSILLDGNGLPRFVGKGDVQLFFGWNNQTLQRNAGSVDFQLNSGETTTWTCTRTWVTGPEGNETEHETVQNRHNTTSIQAFFTTQGRDLSEGLNGPNTGFVLTVDGDPTIIADGPGVGTCPADPSGFVYDENAVTTPTGSGLQIIVNLGAPGPFLTPTGKAINTWYNFP